VPFPAVSGGFGRRALRPSRYPGDFRLDRHAPVALLSGQPGSFANEQGCDNMRGSKRNRISAGSAKQAASNMLPQQLP